MKVISQVVCLSLILASVSHGQPKSPKITVEIDSGANPWTSLDFKDDPNNFQFAVVADRTGSNRPTARRGSPTACWRPVRR